MTDLTTGIKMFRRAIFNDLKLEASNVGWAFALEMTIKAYIADQRIGEVPILSIDRLFGGESTFRVGPWTLEYMRWFLWGVGKLWSHRQRTGEIRRLKVATLSRR